MEVIREIQEKYRRLDIPQEYRVQEIFEPRNIIRNRRGGHRRRRPLFRKDIQHWVSFKNHNIWCIGQINCIEFRPNDSIWSFSITYPNRSGERAPYRHIHFYPENQENDQFLPRQCKMLPIQNHIIPMGSLQRNTPVPENIPRTEDNEKYTWITCYISTEKQTLQKIHKWCMGILSMDGTVTLRRSYRGWSERVYGEVGSLYITTPVSSARRRTEYIVPIFEQFENQIYEEVKLKTDNEKAEKKAIQKENTKKLRAISKQNKVVLNDLTVRFMKRKPLHVYKTCMAAKKGWVNKFGKPITWEHAHVFIKGISSNVFRFMSTFMDGEDVLRLACTNRKNNFDLINHSFIESQLLVLRQRKCNADETEVKKARYQAAAGGMLATICHSITPLQYGGNKLEFKNVIKVMNEKKRQLETDVKNARSEYQEAQQRVDRLLKKIHIFKRYL